MDLTPTIPLHQIVAFAVLRSGGADRYVDTEDVAIEANRIAPGRFTWRKYPDQINLELIRVYLSDGKKASKGALLLGSGTKGWRLSVQGIEWASVNASLLEGLLGSPQESARGKRATSVDKTRSEREIKRIQATSGWKRWTSNRDAQLSRSEAAEVFRIDSYTTGNLVDIKIGRLLRIFDADSEISSFLKAAHAAIRGK